MRQSDDYWTRLFWRRFSRRQVMRGGAMGGLGLALATLGLYDTQSFADRYWIA